MTTRDHAPAGAPTWIDLWTSDVAGARAFYGSLFGWNSDEPNPDFGGYFMFTLDGVPVAGAMGDMGDVKADDSWKVYFDTTDIDRAASAVARNGGTNHFPPTTIGELGTQFVFTDPSGATVGAWQAGAFPGLTVLDEPSAPSWFELRTRDHAGAVEFYGDVFGWTFEFVSDTDEFRYAMANDPEGDMGYAGLMDSRNDLAEGVPAFWKIYWNVADVDATIATALSLGGSVIEPAMDTPHGRMAVLADPSGAEFSLRTPPPA